MRLIEIQAQENGAHRNQTIITGTFWGEPAKAVPVPDGWAVIHEDEGPLENFPFGTFETEEIDGIPYMKRNSWIPGEMPDPVPEPEPEEESSVWDELDAAYQEGYSEGYTEGVNGAYDQ